MTEQRRGVPRDDALFVGGQHPNRNLRTMTVDTPFADRISVLVDECTEPGAAGDYLAARLRVALADAAGEHNSVQPAQRCCKRSNFSHDPINEQVDRFTRLRLT